MKDISSETGILYLCATPIGNMGDITKRVEQTLREVDLIAAEDTRNSQKLLNQLGIRTPMTSYHEHNQAEKGRELIDKLKSGTHIALITDAGTPAISDPGEMLVRMCMDAGIPVTSLPGPSALITALTLSGMNTRRFVFEGFLPSATDDRRNRRQVLDELKREFRTIILYEAPHHLVRTLEDLYATFGERRITVCRELTKVFEEIIPTTLSAAIEFYSEKRNAPRGEFVLVVEGFDRLAFRREQQEELRELDLDEHMRFYEDQGYTRKEAMKKVAADRGLGKSRIYGQLNGKQFDNP